MECPNCRFNNPTGLRFCGGCGSQLSASCPDCQFENPGDFKFCGSCGCRLHHPAKPQTPLSADEKLAKIARYLPTGITEKILAQRDKIEGEKKQVTVMFCDMEGFTHFTESLGSEETYRVMDQVYEILIQRVHRFGGTVNEMTGDGIIALFGAPISQEDAPQRAIRAALSIQKEISESSDRILGNSMFRPIRMRIGINTGPVVVGTLGNDLRVEFKAVGDTVNLASRMEKIAKPGTIYVTEATYRQTEGFFQFESLGEKEVKGREQPVNIYRVMVPFAGRTRFDVNAQRGLSPFEGRSLEMELLLDCFERIKGGQGQVFSIVSEAGVGKSRLLYEFRNTVAHENVTFLTGRCLSYGTSMAYHPLTDLLKSTIEINEEDNEPVIRKKVIGYLEFLKVTSDFALPCLLELLSVKNSGIEKISMSPEAKKDRIIETLKTITLRGAEFQPIIIAIEDLHWIDAGSEECLRYLLESLSGTSVLLIFTYRPEYVPKWGGRSYYNQVILNRLSNRESSSLITNLLGSKDVDEALERLILDKADGVPFFIEEFIKSLRDMAFIEKKRDWFKLAKNIREVAIPSTIQEIIMARIDSLSENAKELLQTGSVIEREFSCQLIRHVQNLSGRELRANLAELEDTELVYEKGVFPDSTIVFKHALTREVAHDSILNQKKAQLHETIAISMESLYRENIEEYYGVLADHYIAGENHEKGAEYARRMSKKAEKSGVLVDAITYTRKGISSLEKLDRTDRVQKDLIDIRTVLGLYYIQFNYHVKAKEAIDPIIELAVSRNYRKRLSQIYTIMGTYYYLSQEDFKQAFKCLNDALEISQAENDIVSLFFANHFLGLALSFNCEFDNAFACYQKALDINQATGTLWGIAAMKCMTSYFVYYSRGKIDASYQTSLEALSIAEESGDIYSMALAHTSHGISCYGKGLFNEAESHLLEGIGLCERIGLFYWNAMAQATLAEAYYEKGDYRKAEDHHNAVVSLLEYNQMIPFWIKVNKMGAARARARNNETDVDVESLIALEGSNPVNIADGWMKRYIGEILMNLDDDLLPEAEKWIEKSMETDQQNDMQFNLGKDYALYAELLNRKGDRIKSDLYRQKALDVFHECGADGFTKG